MRTFYKLFKMKIIFKKYCLILTIPLLLAQINLFGQINSNTVKHAILSADTVFFVSHNLTHQRIVEDGVKVKFRESPPIILRQRPNKKIIRETVLISNNLRLQLIKILTQPNYEGEIKSMSCFLPHHSILLIKNRKTSSIELCFACRELIVSKGIGISDIHYPNVMWTQLENLFLRLGIKYQIPLNEKE